MPHHEIHASGSLDNSGCKRLRISSLVDMPEEENIYVLYNSGIKLLDEMRACGMDTTNRNKMLDRAFNDNVDAMGALKTVIELLQSTLAAHPGGPAAATAAVPNAHVPASAPPANSAPAEHPPPPAPIPLPLNAALPSGRAHSASLEPLPPPAKRARTRRPQRDVREAAFDFLHEFSTFTVQYGINHVKSGGQLPLLLNRTMFDAFKARYQMDAEAQVHHYFDRHAWEAAVKAEDISLFRAQRRKSPVQEAATIEAKLELCPNLRPLVDWCAAWLQNQPKEKRRWCNLLSAFQEDLKAAQLVALADNSTVNPPFNKPMLNHRACYGIKFEMLVRYVFPEESGTHIAPLN